VNDVGPPSVDGDELATLTAFLDYLRDRIVAKLTGVDDAAARTSQVASGTTIYWLGTHMAAVEINQSQRILDGRAEDALVPPPPPAAEHDSMTDVVARYESVCDESRRILSGFDDLGAVGRGVDRKTGGARTVRWVLTHLIEETARHAGHLDILREQLDGSAGR
jgi:hypothetical protein